MVRHPHARLTPELPPPLLKVKSSSLGLRCGYVGLLNLPHLAEMQTRLDRFVANGYFTKFGIGLNNTHSLLFGLMSQPRRSLEPIVRRLSEYY
jgi:hypothetical protein